MSPNSLDKNPGGRPIGIGDVIRRIIGRRITKCLNGTRIELPTMPRPKIWHRICNSYAENAFNSLNRNLALKNIANIRPSILPILPAIKNSYSNPSKIFVKKFIQSREGTTQGDPIAMAMKGQATLSLMN